jgi:hypothetical protein
MLVGDGTSLVPNIVVYILKTAFSKELVTRTEWNLDDARQFCQVSRDDFLDVCNSLQNMLLVLDKT